LLISSLSFQQGLRYRRTTGGLRMAFIQRRPASPKRCGGKARRGQKVRKYLFAAHRILCALPNVYRYEDLAFTRSPMQTHNQKAHPHAHRP